MQSQRPDDAKEDPIYAGNRQVHQQSCQWLRCLGGCKPVEQTNEPFPSQQGSHRKINSHHQTCYSPGEEAIDGGIAQADIPRSEI